jgi:N-acyl-D-aspartate/D-glutamate deacylase
MIRQMAPSFPVTGLLIAAGLVLALGGCADTMISGSRVDPTIAVDELLSEYSTGRSPGVAAMVIRDGEVLLARGYGLANLAEGTAIRPDTAFRLASVSKQFTATAIMVLADRGQLSLDDKVVDHLPELERYGDRMTIRHLLTHTSGLPDYYDALEAESTGSMPDTAAAMEFLSGWGEPLFPPGQRFEYSNPGYEMLALIAERVSGQSLRELLQDTVFGPLGMADTVVRDLTEPEIANRALGYSRKDDGSYTLNDTHSLNHIIGSGGLYSSLEDLFLWDQALYTEQLVSRATLEQAWSPVRLPGGGEHPYGFGFRLGRYGALGRRIAHSGSWVGFRTHISRYPERRFTVIVLANLEDVDSERIANQLTNIYYPATLIENATVVDGTGQPRFTADVLFEGDHIAAVGDLEARAGDLVVAADGLVLAPGFIDAHSHADSAIFEHPEALAAVSQGITTTVVGQDGGSSLPLQEFFGRLEDEPAAVNVASYAGHGTLRMQVMGEDFTRHATAAEINRMSELLAEEMAAGALGLSTGLEYDPGIYSTTEEVVALARVAAAHGGRYISHIRSEDRHLWQSIDEIVTIGREAEIPVQISHLKLAMTSLHGETERLLGILDEARAAGVEVTADIYPYTFWQSTLTVLFPDRDFEDLSEATYVVEEIAAPEGMLIPVFEPEPSMAGKTLAEIAALRGTDPARTLLDLIGQAEALRAERGQEADDQIESVIAVSMDEADIERLMAWPFINICTDGELDGAHPRGFGSFARVLGRFVRERQVLSLEAAIQRMTGQTAVNLNLTKRGRIQPGDFADLVLLDPDQVVDRATPEQPQALSEGIEMVWVNGRLVYEDGLTSGRLPGRVLRRMESP